MKVTELKNWSTLTEAEKARLIEIYNVDEDGNLPEAITKTMAQPTPPGAEGGVK